MSNISRIKRICDANGISGFEDEVLTAIREEAPNLGTFTEDSMRNLYLAFANNKGGRPVIQLDAHTDEVGFMVKCIRDDGMLEFIPIGGWVNSNIPAHRVRVRNMDGHYVQGLVGSKPPHYMSEAERNAAPEITSMIIDIGSFSYAESVNTYKIGVAAPVVPEATCSYNEQSGLLWGKAFDCRLGCTSILDTLEALQKEELSVDLIAGFASQEEVGCRGAIITSRTIDADLAICFEGVPADDTFLPAYQRQTAVGKGPMLRHIDSKTIINPRFQRFALDVAKQCNIPVQEAVRSGGSTNASQIHIAQRGIPTIVIGIPVRYAHTHWGISSLSDVENAVKLGVAIIKALDAETIAGF
ncbi:M20/M25/M40 family metallo-hydrolase [Sphaerochaeta sp. PS]|uniref:M42 family metallopeptidase n=1 Tax=Sphaerochaeta sp. PS TaxID=3076336 RepID=UPI0028A45805|nr:M20/M25/M40 family metallo-hydrolase [Sphaerochaeta sp. PS]MDT4762834.1 M20/M25/M40 family metallo-hydrolase [Sphaerochaeta sp. PS]